MGPTLEVADLRAGYSDLDILHSVSLRVDPREVVCVIGPNGAGKSTLLKSILGLCRIHAGTILFEEEDLVGRATNRIVEAGIGYVPQLANVFASLTVDENLDMGAFLRPAEAVSAKERVYSLFPDLRSRVGERVSRLSGGQRQMVAMGRALMLRPRALLLDEPTAGLAPKFQEEVFRNVRSIAESGTAVLLVEQNAKKALAASDRAYVLEQGRNKYEGPAKDLLADERVGRLYLGGD